MPQAHATEWQTTIDAHIPVGTKNYCYTCEDMRKDRRPARKKMAKNVVTTCNCWGVQKFIFDFFALRCNDWRRVKLYYLRQWDGWETTHAYCIGCGAHWVYPVPVCCIYNVLSHYRNYHHVQCIRCENQSKEMDEWTYRSDRFYGRKRVIRVDNMFIVFIVVNAPALIQFKMFLLEEFMEIMIITCGRRMNIVYSVYAIREQNHIYVI